jgi:hypothetical protein
MKPNVNAVLLLWMILLFMSHPLWAQDKKKVLQDSLQTSSKNSGADYLKDTSLLKADTIKKTVAADSSDNTPPPRSHFQANLTFESNDVYLGRQDSSVLPLLTPEISYLFKSGFEIDFLVGVNVAAPAWMVNSYTLDGSYSFSAGNYGGQATLSWFNYSVNSGSPQSSQKGSLAYDNNYNFGFIQPDLTLTWTFADMPDYQVSFALEHEFDFLKNGNLSITPTATMNASTQNFYNAYYKNKRFSIPRPGKPPYPDSVSISGEVLNSGKFQIMDYEFSAPVNFTAGNWTFGFTPTYAVPVNAADIKLSVKTNNHAITKTYQEILPDVFYYQISVTYAF